MSKKHTVNIKGTEYETVASRLTRFREEHSNWSIMTTIERFEAGECIIKAEILTEDGVLRATGIAHEKEGSTFINKTSYVEVAETSAIGRALACLGYLGSEFASADEVANAIKNQDESGSYKTPSNDKATEKQQGLILSIIAKKNLQLKYKDVKYNTMTKSDASQMIDMLQKEKVFELGDDGDDIPMTSDEFLND